MVVVCEWLLMQKGRSSASGLHERGRFKYAFARGISGLAAGLAGLLLVGGERRECDGNPMGSSKRLCGRAARGRLAAIGSEWQR